MTSQLIVRHLVGTYEWYGRLAVSGVLRVSPALVQRALAKLITTLTGAWILNLILCSASPQDQGAFYRLR